MFANGNPVCFFAFPCIKVSEVFCDFLLLLHSFFFHAFLFLLAVFFRQVRMALLLRLNFCGKHFTPCCAEQKVTRIIVALRIAKGISSGIIGDDERRNIVKCPDLFRRIVEAIEFAVAKAVGPASSRTEFKAVCKQIRVFAVCNFFNDAKTAGMQAVIIAHIIQLSGESFVFQSATICEYKIADFQLGTCFPDVRLRLCDLPIMNSNIHFFSPQRLVNLRMCWSNPALLNGETLVWSPNHFLSLETDQMIVFPVLVTANGPTSRE